MADLFGAPLGDMAFQQNELTKANTQHTLGEVAMQPTTQRLRAAQAKQLEQEIAQNEKFAELMRLTAGERANISPELIESGTVGEEGATMEQLALNPQGAPRVSIADQLDIIAKNAAGAGLITKAQELAKSSALIRSREAVQGKAEADQNLARLKLVRERAELQSQLLGGVTDEESWQNANALYEFQTGQKSPYAQVPYSPELVERLNQAAMTARERAELAEREQVRRNTEAYRKSRLRQIDTQNDLRKKQQELAREREKRLAKAGGGKGVVSPGKNELDQAARLVKKDYSGLEAVDLNDAAFTIASEARALRKANPALDANTALQQAFNNAVQAGDFQVVQKGIAGFGRKETFSGRGKTPAAPAPIPPKKEELKSGRFYVNPQGQVAKWTGKGFVIERPLSGNNGRVDDPDLEDDEDEEE